jgi:putative FmdB family regulatory protein
MPIYEYLCPSCGHHYDALRPIEQRNEELCEKCGQGPFPPEVRASNFAFPGGSPTAWAGKSKTVPTRNPAPKCDPADIPTVGPDGKLYDTRTGKVLRE